MLCQLSPAELQTVHIHTLYLNECFIHIQHGEVVSLSHCKFPVLSGLHGWDSKNVLIVMLTEHFCQISSTTRSFWKPFFFSTYSSFLLIGRHNKYILNLHHCRNGDNLFGAAKVSWLQEHLGKHGAERKLCHPHTHGISQMAVMVQTCQQTHSWFRFCIMCKDTLACRCLPTLNFEH